MRDIFVEQLIKEIKEDPSIILLTADLGFGSFDQLSKDFSANFLNVGVAEQNMIGVASGMAIMGRKPFCYSIGNFSTLRCLEQIRNDAAYHSLNLSIVSNGAGFSYGGLGVTHHATEDVSIMLSIPEIKLLTPSTDQEVKKAVKLACIDQGTKYLRLDKSFVKEQPSQCNLKSFKRHKEGQDLLIFCYGGILEEAIKLSEMISSIEVGIVTVPIISSIEDKELLEIVNETKRVIVLEENSLNGGLCSRLSSILFQNKISLELFKTYGLPRKFSDVVGDQNYMRNYFKIDAVSIFDDINKIL